MQPVCDKVCAYRDPGARWLEGMNLATWNPGHQHSCFVEVSKPQHILYWSSVKLAFQRHLSTSAAHVKAADVSVLPDLLLILLQLSLT